MEIQMYHWNLPEGALNELLYADNLVLWSVGINKIAAGFR